MKKGWLLIPCMLSLAACEDQHKESKDLTAADVVADIRINRQGNAAYTTATRIIANLKSDDIDVKLTNGDRIQAIQGNSRVTLLRDRQLGDHTYSATTDIKFDPDTRIQIVMAQGIDESRDDRWYPIDLLPIELEEGKLHAESFINMPTPLAVTQPSGAVTINSSAETVTLSWEQSNNQADDMQLFYQSTCNTAPQKRSGEISISGDPGTITVPVSELLMDQGLDDSTFDNNDQASEVIFWLLMALLYQDYQTTIESENSARSEQFISQNIQANATSDNSCDINMTLVRESHGEVDPGLNGQSTLLATHSVVQKVYYRP
ncbi:hypothetical protein [Pelagibaculum spongiae]|uniref:Uncharacterized protein n=1 Tax=Pelagibaculum spongiae TaxID=2080658 RepID=A0A2V1GWI7_9GAMM|nr:hypothetical protein [Pelagibaculum spongiae]PVZ70370.1 hypothetical protein DC094_07185 [Pelagibaculum spongiae]